MPEEEEKGKILEQDECNPFLPPWYTDSEQEGHSDNEDSESARNGEYRFSDLGVMAEQAVLCHPPKHQ